MAGDGSPGDSSGRRKEEQAKERGGVALVRKEERRPKSRTIMNFDLVWPVNLVESWQLNRNTLMQEEDALALYLSLS